MRNQGPNVGGCDNCCVNSVRFIQFDSRVEERFKIGVPTMCSIPRESIEDRGVVVVMWFVILFVSERGTKIISCERRLFFVVCLCNGRKEYSKFK